MKIHQVLKTTLAAALVAVSLPLASSSVSADGELLPTHRVAGAVINTEIVDPAGIAVTADGTVFAADLGSNRIIKFEQNATNWTLVSSAAGAGNGLDQLLEPTSLVFNAAGDMFVADAGNSRIMRWAPGATAGEIVAGTGVAGAGLDQFAYPTQIAFGDNGEMYVADAGNNRVVRFDTLGAGVSGVAVAGTGVNGAGLDQLFGPMGVAVASGTDPDVFVADSNNNRIMRFTQGTADGVVYAGAGVNSYTTSPLNYPGSLYFQADGTLFAADQFNGRVVTIDSFGLVTRAAGDGTMTFELGSTRIPRTITMHEGNLYIGEYRRISKWEPYATTGAILMGPMSEPQDPFTPMAGSFRIGPDGGAYVADGTRIRLIDVASGSSYLMVDGGDGGSGLDLISSSDGIAIDTDGNIYVSDAGNARVVKWVPGATAGVVVAGNNGYGTGLDQLLSPTGIDLNSQGSVFVSDAGNNRVVRWDAGATEGVVVAGGNGPGADLNQIGYGYDVRVDANDAVYVADYSNNRVVRWDAGATEGVVVAGGNGGGFAADQTWEPMYIALDGSGGVYVSSAHAGRVAYWANGATEGVALFTAHSLGRPAGVDVDATSRAFVLDSSYIGLTAQVLDAAMSFAPVADKVLGTGNVTLSLTKRAGSYPAVTSTTPAVCTVAGMSVTLVKAGSCTIKAEMVNETLWLNNAVTASFSISEPVVTSPPTTGTPPTTEAPTTTVPPVTTPPTTEAPTTTVPPVTTPPTTPAPTTTAPVVTPPVTLPPAPAAAALSVKCSASGTRVRCAITKPKTVAAKAKVSYKTVCVAGRVTKLSSGNNANSRVVLIVKTGKGTWKCTTTATSGASKWQKVVTVKVR